MKKISILTIVFVVFVANARIIGKFPGWDKLKADSQYIAVVRCGYDGVARQLFFAGGAFDEKNPRQKVALSQTQLHRFWQESAPLFSTLAAEPHPHTAHQMIQALNHLLPCAPREIFLLAAKCICNRARQAGFPYESLAVGDVVKLIQRVLADHRDLFQNAPDKQSECLPALLEVLDLFVKAGWPEARQLTHRLEEIYR